ncbi:MAG: HD-GYP domain-containing protein [Fusobacteria bacterium]|nr:MAG: HD-GYP domain-containing protein [Fusobacteriota bacterium]KAF0228649.1 MAG: HD-GYP domain-containing [Fusobacteriota bacterium]
MKFNLNEFLIGVANILDIIELDIFDLSTNHSKRISYISEKIAVEMGLSKEARFDLASLSLMHDNGASMKILHENLKGDLKEKIDMMESRKEHCLIGENNIKEFPFITKPKNIIKYHHERYDGSGFFGLLKDEIPLLAQIISFADLLDLTFDLKNINNKDNIIEFVQDNKGKYFSALIVDVFSKISENNQFWEGLTDENIEYSLRETIPLFECELNYNEIRTITTTFAKIIDSKSRFTQIHSEGLSEKLEKMAKFYKIDETMTLKLLIAADLHDIGKLAISNNILEKPDKLSKLEFDKIKEHPNIAKQCLQNISGFEEIVKLISNHHEKLNGSGYPEGLMADELDFNSRLITCMDIYQALSEDRPYRKAMSQFEASQVLKSMALAGELDVDIVRDVIYVYSNLFENNAINEV